MKPFDAEHNARVLKSLAEQGIEMTPVELAATRKAAFANIRLAMRAKGWEMPDSDEDLFAIMREARSRQVEPMTEEELKATIEEVAADPFTEQELRDMVKRITGKEPTQ